MKTSKNVRYLTQLALLTALVLLMANTFLGYIRVGALTMSLLTIPVAIGAMLCGPLAGAWLGMIFGPVSYTHPAPSTRTTPFPWKRTHPSATMQERCVPPTPRVVSYTHLDVYKRQG